MNTTDRGLVQRQKEVMKLQDDMILEIETGLTTLHGKVQSLSHRYFFLLFFLIKEINFFLGGGYW